MEMDTASASSAPPITLLGAMWRHKGIVVLGAILGLVAGVSYVQARPPQPTATAMLVVGDPSAPGNDGSMAARYTADQRGILSSYAIAAQAASTPEARQARLSPAELLRATVTSAATANSLSVSFTDASPRRATAAVNSIVTAYKRSVKARVADRTFAAVAAIDAALSDLNAEAPAASAPDAARNLDRTQLAAGQLLAQRAEYTTLAAEPTPGVLASSPPHVVAPARGSILLRDAAFGVLLGVLAAAGAAYLLATRRRRLLRPSDVTMLLDAPLLGTLDLRSGAVSMQHAVLAAAGVERVLDDDDDEDEESARIVAVVAPARADDASAVASAVAGGLEAMGTAVLLIDLTTEPEPGESGLAPVAQGMIGLSKVMTPIVTTGGPEVQAVRGGVAPGAPAVQWSSELADELASAPVDRIVVAAHDPSDPASAITVLSHVDGAVVVVPAGSRAGGVAELIDRLTTLGLPPMGCVFVQAAHRRPTLGSFALRRPESSGAQVRVALSGG